LWNSGTVERFYYWFSNLSFWHNFFLNFRWDFCKKKIILNYFLSIYIITYQNIRLVQWSTTHLIHILLIIPDLGSGGSSGTIVWHHFYLPLVSRYFELPSVSGICLLFLDSGVLLTKKANQLPLFTDCL
jgi:hypothetical protein